MYGLEMFAKAGWLVFLLVVAAIITDPNLAPRVAPLIGWLLVLWLLWRPLKRVVKWFFEGLFVGLGLRGSGVVNRLSRPARRPYNDRAIRRQYRDDPPPETGPGPVPKVRGFTPEQVRELQRRYPGVIE
jgi:hypothetical protein